MKKKPLTFIVLSLFLLLLLSGYVFSQVLNNSCNIPPVLGKFCDPSGDLVKKVVKAGSECKILTLHFKSCDAGCENKSCNEFKCQNDTDCLSSMKCDSYKNICYTYNKCQKDTDCSYDESCILNSCRIIECECGVLNNHSCNRFECCSDSECSEGKKCNNNINRCGFFSTLTSYSLEQNSSYAKALNLSIVKISYLFNFSIGSSGLQTQIQLSDSAFIRQMQNGNTQNIISLKAIENADITKKDEYTLVIFSFKDIVLFSGSFNSSLLDNGNNNIIIAVPYFADARELNLYKDSELKGSYDLSDYLKCNMNSICDNTETVYSCYADCKCGDMICDNNENFLSCPFDCTKEDGSDKLIGKYLIYLVVIFLILICLFASYRLYLFYLQNSALTYLKVYIKDAKSKGFTDFHIKHKLLASGYDKKLVDKALSDK